MAVRRWLRWRGLTREDPLDAQLNVYNVAAMLARPRARYEFLRIDSNNTCNVQCVYCHNHRSAAIVPTEAMLEFLADRVIAVRHVQIGCVMEPTLDERLADLLLEVRRIRPPEQALILQTNGILLHRHDHGKLAEAGLTLLSVSIDSADAQVHKILRGGTSLAKVDGNVRRFRDACPRVDVHFITTVTRVNLRRSRIWYGSDSIWGSRGSCFARSFTTRTTTSWITHGCRICSCAQASTRRWPTACGRSSGIAAFDFADGARLVAAEQKMLADSLRTMPLNED